MTLTILNDTHLGVQRVAGTTPRSAAALNEWINQRFEGLVLSIHDDLCINGDLFDQYIVPNRDLLFAYRVLMEWRETTGAKLHLVPGNHDLSKDSSRLSSFELLAMLLQAAHPSDVKVYMAPGWVNDDVWVIPHLANQDLFDVALSEVPKEAKFVLLHANYDNHFAEQSDHSLNVSEQQAQKLIDQGAKLIFAHEHQHRKALDGGVVIVGNQIPTSVADCLGPDRKWLAVIEGEELRLEEVMQIDQVFEMIDWRDLSTPMPGDTAFIRVTGEASANEAADVVSAIAKYRAKSDAFVITNAVKIEGVEAMDKLPETLESAKAFDVLGAILESLDPEEQKVVKKLLEEA